MFHGVGGDYLHVTADTHKKLLQYLNARQNGIWGCCFPGSNGLPDSGIFKVRI